MKRIVRRRILILAFVLFGLIAISSTVDAVNIGQGLFNEDGYAIQNTGFESGTTKWIVERGSASRSTSERTGSYSLYVSQSENMVVLSQSLLSKTVGQAKGKYVEFSFWFKSYDDSAKAKIGYYRYMNYGYKWYWYENDWVSASNESGDLAWIQVRNKAYISSHALQIKVKIIVDDINGYRYTSSFIDNTSLTIAEETTISTNYGTASLAIRIATVKNVPFTSKNKVEFAVAIGLTVMASTRFTRCKYKLSYAPIVPFYGGEKRLKLGILTSSR